MFRTAFLLMAALPLLGACSDVPTACTTEPRPAVVATIVDSITGKSAIYSASLVLQNATTYDSSFFNENLGVTPATDGGPPYGYWGNPAGIPGKYTMRVRRQGYQLWQVTGVVVKSESCGAVSTRITVRLQPGV